MVAPLLWGLFALVLGACAASRRGEREQTKPPTAGQSPAPFDPCPGEPFCACSEKTGWIRGAPPRSLDDNYVLIGDHRIDIRKELFSAKDPFGIVTYFPVVDFQFQLGSAEPQNPAQFAQQTNHLTNELLKFILRKYPCVTFPSHRDPVVYVSGHADRVGEENFNLDLSKRRALQVAQDVEKWLRLRSFELMQAVRIEYVGMGEKEAMEKGGSDDQANLRQRRVDVIALSTGRPFGADWQVLGTVYPAAQGGAQPQAGTTPPSPRAAPKSMPRAVQDEIRQSCQREAPHAVGCVDRVAQRVVDVVRMTCQQTASLDNLSVETCQDLLVTLPWLNLEHLQKNIRRKIPRLAEAIIGPHPLKASDGTTHRSLVTFIRKEAQWTR